MRLRTALSGLLAACCLLGCDPTAADCRQLVAQLNGSVDRLRPELVTDAGPPAETAESMRRFGMAVGEEADALEALTLEAPKLVAERDAYVAAARHAATAATAWANALDDKGRARTEGDAAKAALDDNLDELEKRCEASTCFELMERLARSRQAPIASLPNELDGLADDLKRITTDVAEIDDAIAEHRKQIRRFAKALRAMREAEAEASQQRRALVEAAATEEPAVDRINTICRP